MEQTNKIGQDFTLGSLTLFGLPSFFTNVFAQVFKSLDDGLFISRYVGETALASVNLLNPLVGIQMAIEHLFSLGASNISARYMGENNQQEAKRVFTRICISSLIASSLFALLVNVFSLPILNFLGAESKHIYFATTQVRIVFLCAPITMLTRVFNCYYSTAGKPKMGMYCSIINGVVNISLDILLIVIFDMGVVGACIGTAAGDFAVFIFGIIFYCNKNNEIHFVRPEGKLMSTSLQSAKYALPQCLNAASFSATTYISNIMILKIIGSTGIAANAIVSDVRKILTSGLIGFAVCVGPIISYNVGSKNVDRLRKILSYILMIWIIGSFILTAGGLLLRQPLLSVFMSEKTSEEFYNMSMLALTIEIFATAPVSACIFISRIFIALGNAKASIINSLFRNLIIKSIMFIMMPILLGEIGIWLSVPISELISCIFGFYLIYINRDNYGYGKDKIAYKINS